MKGTGRRRTEFLVHRFIVQQREREVLKTTSERCVITGKPHILVVEDNMIVQTYMKRQFEILGCKVILASNSEAVFKHYNPSLHLLLMDIDLPDLPGLSVANWIRTQKLCSNNRIPIIGHTHYVDEEVEYRCYVADFDNVIRKLETDEECQTLLRVWLPEFMALN